MTALTLLTAAATGAAAGDDTDGFSLCVVPEVDAASETDEQLTDEPADSESADETADETPGFGGGVGLVSLIGLAVRIGRFSRSTVG